MSWQAPASDGSSPRWSVVIPAHNCADLLVPCLQGVLGQLAHRGDAEIVVVDDGSTDDPASVVQRLGAGRVRLVRNETALGAVPNFNRCLHEARGEYIHLLHGDDVVLPGFYEAMDEALADPGVSAAFCRTQHIDQNGTPLAVTRSYVPGGGVWTDALHKLASSNRVAAPSIVVKASTYASVGGFDEALPHAADWDMWARAATAGDVHFVDRVLAQYRVHPGNDTSKRLRTGANMEERYRAMEHMLSRVPAADRTALRRQGAALGAVYAARQTLRQLRQGDLRTAGVQARWVARSLRRVVG
ncbi:MAG: glycosyltransferase [Propionibacterium sp.]|nr:glycosyltransferase [Propionibacterium sp.]